MSSMTLLNSKENTPDMHSGEVGTCCLCGGEYVLFGRDPDPLDMDEDARCCAKCDVERVAPARSFVYFKDNNEHMANRKESGICCLCGSNYDNYGRNPSPVVMDEDARCCDKCDRAFVIPIRILMFKGRNQC